MIIGLELLHTWLASSNTISYPLVLTINISIRHFSVLCSFLALRLRYPSLNFTIKNIQNKKYIKFSKLKKILNISTINFSKELRNP